MPSVDGKRWRLVAGCRLRVLLFPYINMLQAHKNIPLLPSEYFLRLKFNKTEAKIDVSSEAAYGIQAVKVIPEPWITGYLAI